jgi:hypothetical protein
MAIKAIETIYNGYRFRSRLEARWAVFFDVLKIEYRYEPEGYDLPMVGYYLPDFYVPSWETWFEIKGSEPTETERQKCLQLALVKGQDVILLQGDVWPDHGITWFEADSGVSIWGSSLGSFGSCRKCDQEIWLVSDEQGYAHCLTPLEQQCEHDRYPLSGEWSSMIFQAYQTARQARFEHGETPRIP